MEEWFECSENLPGLRQYVLVFISSRKRIGLCPFVIARLEEMNESYVWDHFHDSYRFDMSDWWRELPNEPPFSRHEALNDLFGLDK